MVRSDLFRAAVALAVILMLVGCSVADIYGRLGCSPKCGRCARTIREIMRNALREAAADQGSHECSTACASACSLVLFQTAEDGITA